MRNEHVEQALIRGLQLRDSDVMYTLYKMYSGSLYGVITRIVPEKELAEDILQEAFMKIWKYGARYDVNKGRLFTWMLNVTRNLAIDTLRCKSYKKSLRTVDTDSYFELIELGNIHFDASHEAIGITSLLRQLKPEISEVIRLHYLEGLTHFAIAEELDQALGTVKSRLRTGIFQLRKIIATDLAYHQNIIVVKHEYKSSN